MTIGAAYDVLQTFGWRHGLHARALQAKPFYIAISVSTLSRHGPELLGLNPIKALVWAGIVQGFSTPFLMPLIVLLTNSRGYGEWANTTGMKVLGWTKTVLIFSALVRLVVAWFR